VTPARSSSGAEANGQTGLEVADVFRRHLDDFRKLHTPDPLDERLARDLISCRTALLGGHLLHCTTCGHEHPVYNSCRNRHCPKCQALRSARWVAERLNRVLPVHYFHVVFTLPAELRDLARRHPKPVFDLLLKSAAAGLLTLGRDPQWWGGSALLGVTTVLHTWTRDLQLHPHAHCIVTGGGLAEDGSWVAAPQDFLFPVHVLGALFRGKFLDGLERLRARGLLPGERDDRAWRRQRTKLYKKSWVVYAKRPFGGAEQVYRYLGRYTHRVAISNTRLLHLDDDAVVFKTRGPGTASLDPVEFIRRFLQHRLPPGFTKIRHSGLLAPINIRTAFAKAKAVLAPPPLLTAGILPAVEGDQGDDEVPLAKLPWPELLLRLTGFDVRACPQCRSHTLVCLPLPEARAPPAPAHLN
jgi:Putative transposase/Transposase zinc-binding domain